MSQSTLLTRNNAEVLIDQSLAHRVTHVLSVLHIPALRQVQVAVEGGTVTLSGRVRTYHQRQLAYAAIHRLPGVDRVVIELVVDDAQPIPVELVGAPSLMMSAA